MTTPESGEGQKSNSVESHLIKTEGQQAQHGEQSVEAAAEKSSVVVETLNEMLDNAHFWKEQHKSLAVCEHPRTCGACHFWSGVIACLEDLTGEGGVANLHRRSDGATRIEKNKRDAPSPVMEVTPTLQDSKGAEGRETQNSPADLSAARIAELEKQIEMGKSVLRSCVDRDHYPKDSLYMLCMVASNAIHYRNQEMDRRQFEIKELLAERAALLEERDRLRDSLELIIKICHSTKHKDARGDIVREAEGTLGVHHGDKNDAPAIGAAASKSSGESEVSSATESFPSSPATPKTKEDK